LAGAQHGSDLIIRWLSDGAESTTAHDDESIHGVIWSADGSSIAYIGGSKVIHHDESPSIPGPSSFIEFPKSAGTKSMP